MIVQYSFAQDNQPRRQVEWRPISLSPEMVTPIGIALMLLTTLGYVLR